MQVSRGPHNGRTMILYKFTSPNIGEKILLDRFIRFSQIAVLNDPFDGVPSVSEFFSEEQIQPFLDQMINASTVLQDVLERTLAESYERIPAGLRFLFTKSQWVEYARPHVLLELQRQQMEADLPLSGLVLTRMSGNAESYRQDTERMLRGFISSNLGVFSISAKFDHQLLWSHYADAHRGIAIGFDGDHAYYADARPVTYVTSRPSISMRESFQTKEKQQYAADTIVFTKHVDWLYEQEYRMIRPLQNAQKSDEVDALGYPVCLFPFPESCVREVILGARIAPEAVHSIKSVLSGEPYRHVRLYRAACSQTDFSIGLFPDAA